VTLDMMNWKSVKIHYNICTFVYTVLLKECSKMSPFCAAGWCFQRCRTEAFYREMGFIG